MEILYAMNTRMNPLEINTGGIISYYKLKNQQLIYKAQLNELEIKNDLFIDFSKDFLLNQFLVGRGTSWPALSKQIRRVITAIFFSAKAAKTLPPSISGAVGFKRPASQERIWIEHI